MHQVRPQGRYHVHKLIEKYGRNGNMSAWCPNLRGDCPERDGRLNDRSDLVCPDLPKVVMAYALQCLQHPAD